MEHVATLGSGFAPTAQAHSIDITNAIVNARSADCADYAEAYSARAQDVQGNRTLNGELNVASTSKSCTLSSNSVPNHAFNTTGALFVKPVTEIASSFTIPPTRPAPSDQPRSANAALTPLCSTVSCSISCQPDVTAPQVRGLIRTGTLPSAAA